MLLSILESLITDATSAGGGAEVTLLQAEGGGASAAEREEAGAGAAEREEDATGLDAEQQVPLTPTPSLTTVYSKPS